MSDAYKKYNINVGQIYIAAGGSRCGHFVTDVETYSYCDDVVTTPFTPAGFDAGGRRIDAFKLAMVRYKLVSHENIPQWAAHLFQQTKA